MAEGLSSTAANEALTTLKANYTWVKLHTGAPGSAGTSNAAGETTRKQATWSTPSGGSMTTVTTALTWTNVSTSEDYTHHTLWTASTAGTFGWSGSVTANAVVAGDTFTIAVGDLTSSFTLAS